MSQEQSRAEQLLGQGLAAYIGGDDNASKQNATTLFEGALKSVPSLPRPKEIFCRMQLGLVTLELARSLGEMDGLEDQDISQLGKVSKVLKELEKALSLDAESGGGSLADRLSQALIFNLWTSCG
jgi:hypothetical protein